MNVIILGIHHMNVTRVARVIMNVRHLNDTKKLIQKELGHSDVIYAPQAFTNAVHWSITDAYILEKSLLSVTRVESVLVLHLI